MNAVVDAYAGGGELNRMREPRNQLEWVRTCELLERWLPPEPARIADIGAGPGAYALWLNQRSYETAVFDLSPLHVETACGMGLAAQVADAREVPLGDGVVDAVLLLGPLYHLQAAGDRAKVLREAYRVLAPGGVVIAAGLSRWARVLVSAADGVLADPQAQTHTVTMMRHGHIPGTADVWDACSYRHDPGELHAEVAAAGFGQVQVAGVEGPAGAWARRDPLLFEYALELAREAETAMAACSIHLLCAGRKAAH